MSAFLVQVPGSSINSSADAVVDPPMVMLIVPVVAPDGTDTIMRVSLYTIIFVTGRPLNLIDAFRESFPKCFPRMVTRLPGPPFMGVNDSRIGDTGVSSLLQETTSNKNCSIMAGNRMALFCC